MNAFVNNQTAGEYVASKGRRIMKKDKEPASGPEAHATGMKKMMAEHSARSAPGRKTASGKPCGATK